MDLTRAAIEKNRITLVMLVVVALAGITSYLNMPQAQDPGFTIRTALVRTQFPGASPQRVEELITDRLEKAIQEMPEIDSITSQSKSGVSLVFVNIQERYSDMRPIWDSLRRKVDRVAPDLPAGIIGPRVDDEFGDVFGTVLYLIGEGYSDAELKDLADEVRDELLLLPDAAKVEISGAQEERIYVEYNNARLAELGLSPGQLRQLLDSRNIINPGGEVRTESETIVIEPSGSFESVADLKKTLLALPGEGRLVYLGDVAHVYRGYVDPAENGVRVNGERALALAISLREGGNIVELGRQVRERVTRLEASYPIGVELRVMLDQAKVVEKKVDDFVSNLVQAVAIVLAVMLLSLGLRTGLVVASLIPAAIVMAFIFMPMAGVGIDQMSLAALIIALGLLVDNAIVMSESIMVLMGEGVPAKDAAIRSARELRVPLLISSLTTAAAFLPIFLAESAVGEYTGALFIVVTITLLCSWVLALTLIPLLCVLFLKVKPQESEDAFGSRFYRSYRRLLLAGLRHPWVTLALVVLVFFGSLQLFRFVPVIFFPDDDRPTLTAELLLPTGSPMAATDEVARNLDEYIAEELAVTPEEAAEGAEGVTGWLTFVGEPAPSFQLGFTGEQASPEYGILVINTTTREEADRVAARLQTLSQDVPGLEAKIGPLSAGPSAANPIEVRVSGRDSDQVFAYVEAVKAKLASIPGAVGVRDDWGARSKKVVVRIDDARAQRAGVSNSDVALSLQTLFSGINTTEYREGEKVIPVTLRSEDAKLLALDRVGSLNVFSQATGASVPITQVADIEMAWQPAKILRRDRLRTVSVVADLQPGVTATQVNQAITPWLEEISADWPPGYSWELGGEDESSAEANASIGAKLPIAFMLIVLLLVGQFNSLRRPLVILLTIPLGIIGVVVGLLVLRSYFGFMTLLGLISLAGIVINNAIVLIDRIDLEIGVNGLEPPRAVVEASQRRLRPILLTTLTTLGGMIPLYLGGGPMFEPMAAAIMVGLVFATALTLGVVPVLYSLLFRVKYKGFKMA